jgi:hypothetical protein
MQLFSCQHREQHTFKRNYEFTSTIQDIHISRLELHYKDGPLKLVFHFIKYILYSGFGIEVWLIPFGTSNPNLI